MNTSIGFIGYDYKNITVKNELQHMYADGYRNFGWSLENTTDTPHKADFVTLKFKRDRKLRNKAELTRLQRQFDSCIAEIQKLEFSKILNAAIAAYTIGIIATTLIAGAVFAYLDGMIPLMIILAIPGFVGWIVSYISYTILRRKKSEQVVPLIDQKYDEIYEVCKKANELLS